MMEELRYLLEKLSARASEMASGDISAKNVQKLKDHALMVEKSYQIAVALKLIDR